MKNLQLALGCLLLLSCATAMSSALNMVCYYDSASFLRPGFAKLSNHELEMAMQFCSHLIYGYAGIHHESLELFSLNVDLDMFHYQEVTRLKSKFPNLKIYLSVGGDKDLDEAHPLKYLGLLEAPPELQYRFIDTALAVVRNNGFDGLDLAFQLPRNKPRKVHGTIGSYWKKFKKIFTGDFIVDPLAEQHKEQFTELAQKIHQSFERNNLKLSLTVLPNVNSTWYFDIPKISKNFEIINLLAFDFLTPERNPEEADYTAPIFSPVEQDRLPHYNIDFQVSYWLTQGCPAVKLNLGVASYGRAWVMSTDSGLTGEPTVAETLGPAPADLQSNTTGLLSWAEICAKFRNNVNAEFRGANAPLRKVSDLSQKFGNYALRPSDDNGEHGIWISYDDPDFAAIKASYAKNKKLGGMALFDLSFDDFRGLCSGQKYPILRAMKYALE